MGLSSLIVNIDDNMSLDEVRMIFLEYLVSLFHADGGVFFLSDKNQNELDLQNGIIYNLDLGGILQYRQYYQKYDPFRKMWNSNLLCATDQIFPREQWENNLYYNDLLRPDKLFHELVICPRSGNNLLGKIGIFRQKPLFTHHDQQEALLVAKFFEIFINNKNLSKDYDNKINIYQRLHNLSQIGLIILDLDTIKPIYYNATAQKICSVINQERAAGNDSVQGNILIPYEVIRNCQDLKYHAKAGNFVAPYFCKTNIYLTQDKIYEIKCYLDIQAVYDQSIASIVILIEDCAEMRRIEERTAMSKYKLSMRECEICRLVREGFTNREISDQLFISLTTVETHLRNIFGKMKVRNRAELIKSLDYF